MLAAFFCSCLCVHTLPPFNTAFWCVLYWPMKLKLVPSFEASRKHLSLLPDVPTMQAPVAWTVGLESGMGERGQEEETWDMG